VVVEGDDSGIDDVGGGDTLNFVNDGSVGNCDCDEEDRDDVEDEDDKDDKDDAEDDGENVDKDNGDLEPSDERKA